jgi:hypothetical protein
VRSIVTECGRQVTKLLWCWGKLYLVWLLAVQIWRWVAEVA